MYKFNKTAAAIAVASSLAMAHPVFADNSSGSIYGHAGNGATVSIKNLGTGFKRNVVVDEDGRFAFGQLPVGKYEITDGTKTFTVTVSIGTGSSVEFLTDNAERIEVRGARVSAIDVSSVESTTVFTQEQLQLLPVAREVTDVALLAPGTTKGDTGFGNLASFGGASVAENGYYINGFDVTNIRTFLSFADLPFDAIAQQQIKTGGYSAEYGRALGGVVNMVTKSGTNEFQGGAAVYWTPESLRGTRNDSASRDPKDDYAHRYHTYNSANRNDRLAYNVWASGPIIEDKLFFFAMVEGQNNKFEDFNRDLSDTQETKDPQAILKLDWNITDNHLFEFTGIFNESDEKNIEYKNPEGVYYSDKHGEEIARFDETNGGKLYIAKYTGHLTDDLSLSILYGHSEDKQNIKNPGVFDPAAAECPRVFDSRENASSVVYRGCWNQAQTFIPDPNHPGDKDERDALRLDLEYIIGDHAIKLGYDNEKYTADFRGQTYTGGRYFRYFTVPESGMIGGSDNHSLNPGDTFVRTWDRGTLSGSFEVKNSAWYIEDNWQVNDDVLLYMGLRTESFTNKNGEGAVFAKASNQIAPRLGVSWDMDGDGSKKVFANIGRYFIPIAANTNIRAANAEPFIITYYEFDGIDPTTFAPVTLGKEITRAVNGSDQAPNPATITDQNLKPMHQDEYILGYQQELTDDWTLGIRGIYRDIKDGMDDYCSPGGFQKWADDKGYDKFDYHTLADCMIVNPGNDITLAIDHDNDGTFTNHTISNDYFGLPKYKRTYKAVELFWEKAPSDGLYIQGSYTLAKSEGNAEGYVNSTLEQTDPGLTQDFDHARFMEGSFGPLPNDRRHSLKLFGHYKFNDEWSASLNLLAQSGRPRNCNGFIPLDGLHPLDASNLQGYSNSAFFCLKNDNSGDTELRPRGSEGRTPWLYNVDFGVGYTPEWMEGLTVRMDIRNLLGSDIVTEYDEKGDSVRDFANANFGVPVSWQAPRSVRFSLRYTF